MQDQMDLKQRQTFQTRAGTWTLKRLGFPAQLQVGGRAAALIGGPYDAAPANIQAAAWMLATIQLATVQAPPDWDWEAAPDDTVLGDLFEQYQAWDASFRPPVAAPPDPTGRTDGAQSPVLVSPAVSSATA